MDKRYQVFVSSTYRDLQDERREVLEALLELNCIPTAMELFPAADEEAWGVIRRLIEPCDYYVLIIGGRYGSVTAEGVSFTEKEYLLAAELNIPILAFLHGDPDSIPRGKSEIDPHAAARLQAFRERVRKERLVKEWMSAADLGARVTRAVVQAINTYPRPGWVRSNAVAGEEVYKRLTDALDENKVLKEQLAKAIGEQSQSSEQLSQGDDQVTVPFLATFIMENDQFSLNRVTKDWEGEVKLSWNEMLDAIAPELLDEAPESRIRSTLELYALDKARPNIPTLYRRKNVEKFDFYDSAWGRIKLQLVYIGLLMNGTKQRSPSDLSAYFALTPKAKTLVQERLALKRKSN